MNYRNVDETVAFYENRTCSDVLCFLLTLLWLLSVYYKYITIKKVRKIYKKKRKERSFLFALLP